MGFRTSPQIADGFLLAFGLIVLLSMPIQAQDGHQHTESLSWHQKLTSPEGLQEQFDSNPILFFGAVFVLGIGVSLTPCVLPMIPITVSIISGSKQAIPGRSVVRSAMAGLVSSLVYILGVSITYAWLGVLAATLGVVVRGVLQGWLVQATVGTLFVVLGSSMIGLFSLPIPGWGQSKLDAAAQQQKAKRSLLTVFVLGLISGLIASPCVAPVIGALLLWVSTVGIWLGWWTLFVFGWGMGLLLIVVGMTGWTISSGKWMLTVKVALGVILLLMGILIAIQGIRGRPVIPQQWLTSETKQTEGVTATVSRGSTNIEWVHSEPQGLALAKRESKPVLIDFYANWCVYCRKMDQTTFLNTRIIEELDRFVAIKVDLTRISPEGQTAAGKHNVTHLPTYIFIDTKGRKTLQLGYIAPSRFLKILQDIE